PVLRGKAVEREHLDAALYRIANGSAQRREPLAMTFRSRQAPLLGPAAVAVHYNGDVPDRRRAVVTVAGTGHVSLHARRHCKFPHEEPRRWNDGSRARQTCEISCSFLASMASISEIISSVSFCTRSDA